MLRSLAPKDRVTKRRQFPDSIGTSLEFKEAVELHVLDGLLPANPFLTKSSPILTMGSCFAGNIAMFLTKRGYSIFDFQVRERLFNPFALRDFIAGLSKPDTEFADFEHHWKLSRESISALKVALVSGPTVVITLGLSAVWFDNKNGSMIFDPGKRLGRDVIYENPERYEMRQTDVADNFDALCSIVNDIRTLNPSTRIIFTLSPVPMKLASCDYPVMVADCISKSTLRVAIHELTRLRLKDVYYYPSFELLRWFAPLVDTPFFGDGMLSHFKANWIDYVLSKFAEGYCEGESALPIPVLNFSASSGATP